jgi:hypothetical protein
MTEHQNNNEALMHAIELHDVRTVKFLLENGADANYLRYKDEEEPNGLMQPTTPLRMVMFCISNSDLDDSELRSFGEIATLLLLHGGDPRPAMQLAEARYGKYTAGHEKNAFAEVWDIVAKGK